jgi:hypothetical protein
MQNLITKFFVDLKYEYSDLDVCLFLAQKYKVFEHNFLYVCGINSWLHAKNQLIKKL